MFYLVNNDRYTSKVFRWKNLMSPLRERYVFAVDAVDAVDNVVVASDVAVAAVVAVVAHPLRRK